MRQSSGKKRQLSAWATAAATDRLLDFLRREHPANTVDHVFAVLDAAGAGVSRATVAKWFERASSPRFSTVCALIAAYGPRLLSCVLGPGFAWLDEACVAASRREFDGRVERLKREFGIT